MAALEDLREQGEQLVVDRAVGRRDVTSAQAHGIALHIGGAAACFSDQQKAGGHVPRVQTELPEAIQTPARHEARIALRLVLQGTDRVFLEDTLTISEPVVGEGFDHVVEAMALALDESSSEVARRVAAVMPLGLEPGYPNRVEE